MTRFAHAHPPSSETTERFVPAVTLSQSIARGIIGFTLLSIAGFAPWAIFGRWFYRNVGEAGLYIVCALVFLGLSGPLMHKLIAGPRSLTRFYKIFIPAFGAYSIGWIAGWFAFKGHTGSVVGLLAGTAIMALILTLSFAVPRQFIAIFAALFLLNAAGYFIGGVVEGRLARADGFVGLDRKTRVTAAKLLWGVCYGIGFGAGLGIAFHLCQQSTQRQRHPPGA